MKKIVSFMIVFFLFTQSYAQTVSIIPVNSNWKYLANGSNQGTVWRNTSFNDSTWSNGNAQLGYGDGDEATIISYGGNVNNRYKSSYFRKSISIASPSAYTSFTLGLLRDDGAVVYLNGVEVVRSNMPTGTITYTTTSTANISGAAEDVYNNFTLSPAQFVSGTNVIAVEVHQFSATSADFSFDLKLDATPVACGLPTSLSSSSVTSSSALLSWSGVSGALSYNIRYRLSGATTWNPVSTTNASVSISGLTSSSMYEFQVQAVCAASGSFSSSVFFTTLSNGTDTLINTNSAWKYLDNGSNQGSAWRAAAFNDASWSSGNAELGYGDGGEATVVSYGSNSSNKYITTYFRKSFNVVNPSLYSALTLGIVRDDGVVVYINGIEVYRNNLPSGTIAFNTFATAAISGADETAWNNVVIPSSSLVAGANVMSVEIHQNAVSSSDISFNVRLFSSGSLTTPTVVRGAYLQKLSPTGVTIRWRTDIACDSKVQFGNSISYGNSVVDLNLVTEHIVTISGLNAATNYFYSIGTSTLKLQGDSKNNFYTAASTGSTNPVRIWVTGDFGNGSSQQTAVKNSYVTYTGTTPTNLWLWLGDNAYINGTDAEYQTNVFNKYTDQLKSFPLFPSIGNHDYAQVGYQSASALGLNFPYFNIFSVPSAGESGGVASNTPKYYSYNNANIHFIVLDSYGSLNNSTSPMYTWLQNDLSANSQRWTIVYFHHAPYSKGSHDSDTEIDLANMRTNIVPLLENYHVDLVLSGHSHTNERSYLMKGHYGLANSFTSAMKMSTATNTFTKTTPFNGTVYAVCGTSGESPETPQAGYPMPCMFFNNNSNNCSMVIDVSGDVLTGRYLTSAGVIVDQFTINKVGTQLRQTSLENNSLAVYASSGKISVNYYLSDDADVIFELFDIHGKQIANFSNVPSQQTAGHYSFDLSENDEFISSGIYLLRMTVNGVPIVKKVVMP